MKPILKWAGGKRWLAPRLVHVISELGTRRFVEPFAGSAAVMFELEPRFATLCDNSPELIAAYRGIQQSPDAVYTRLQALPMNEACFRVVALQRPDSLIDAAARMIYLNRTSWGGLWRVNKQGKFNVPYGCKPGTSLPSLTELERVAEVFSRTTLLSGDFAQALSRLRSAVVYCDPPYTVTHNNNGFVRYNEKIFSWLDQVRLARILTELNRRGLPVIVSNALNGAVLDLYPQTDFVHFKVSRSSRLASNARFRRDVDEALIFGMSLLRDLGRTRATFTGQLLSTFGVTAEPWLAST